MMLCKNLPNIYNIYNDQGFFRVLGATGTELVVNYYTERWLLSGGRFQCFSVRFQASVFRVLGTTLFNMAVSLMKTPTC